MSETDELERIAAFRATVQFPSQARLTAGRECLLAAAAAERGHAAGAPPARAARRRWRRPVLAGGLITAASATAAAALVLANGPAAAPGRQATAGHSRTVVTAAWTVREDAYGTVRIDLKPYFGPAGLQAALLQRTLRADGVNAIIRTVQLSGVGKQTTGHATCEYYPASRAPEAVQQAVLPNNGLITTAQGETSIVIHPGSMPPGSAVFMSVANFPPSRPGQRAGVGIESPLVLNNNTVPACLPFHAPKPQPSGADG